MNKNKLNDFDLKPLASLVLILTSVWLSIQIFGQIFPVISSFATNISAFILGVIFALLLHPFVDFLTLNVFKQKKALSVLVTFSMVLLILLFIIVPIVKDLIDNFSAIINSLQYAVSYILDASGTIDTSLKNQILSYVSNYGSIAADVLVSSVNNIANGSMQIILTTIVMVFTLLEYDLCKKMILNFFKKDNRVIVSDYIDGLEIQLNAYLKAISLSFAISSIVFGIVLYSLGISHALSFTIIMNLLIVLIPVIGPFIATVILALITIPVSFPAIIFGFIGLFVFMQLFINVISPKIYAQTLSLPNLLIIFSFMAGSAIFGVLGALLAMPVMIVILYTYRFFDKDKKDETEGE